MSSWQHSCRRATGLRRPTLGGTRLRLGFVRVVGKHYLKNDRQRKATLPVQMIEIWSVGNGLNQPFKRWWHHAHTTLYGRSEKKIPSFAPGLPSSPLGIVHCTWTDRPAAAA